MKEIKSEIWVGVLILLALLSAIFICLRAANLIFIRVEPTYRIYAIFDNVSGLKINSPVRIGGVTVGQVADITLDENTYLPRVALDIKKRYNQIPNTSSLSIRISGLLGEQYLDINVGFRDPLLGMSYLKNGDKIHDTKSAIVLEDIISHFLYSKKYNSSENEPK